MSLNVAMNTELQSKSLYLAGLELADMGIEFGVDLGALYALGLIGSYSYGDEEIDTNSHPSQRAVAHIVRMVPTSLGIQLYAIINNKLSGWANYTAEDYEDAPNIKLPQYFSLDKNKLLP